MKFEVTPSHVAVLVPSITKAAAYLRGLNFETGEEESFEETKEIYVQGSERNSLLLMEPKGPGSYQRALQKRGPGLHHLAIDVLDLEGFLGSLSGSGWLLHLNSLKTMKSFRTAYLARPGFPALIEVQEKKTLMGGPDFIEKITLPGDVHHASLANAIGLGHLLNFSNDDLSFFARGRKIALKDLL